MSVFNQTCHKLLDLLGGEEPILELRKRKTSSILLFNGASEPKLWLHTGTLSYMRSAVGRGKNGPVNFIVMVK